MWIVGGRGCFQKAIPGLLNRSKNVILEAAGVFFKGCKEEQEKKYISQLELQSFFLKKFQLLLCKLWWWCLKTVALLRFLFTFLMYIIVGEVDIFLFRFFALKKIFKEFFLRIPAKPRSIFFCPNIICWFLDYFWIHCWCT